MLASSPVLNVIFEIDGGTSIPRTPEAPTVQHLVGAFACPAEVVVPTFENPGIHSICDRAELGTIWDAARVAGVKPGTILVWMTRKKIEPMPLGDGQRLFHLPTIERASKVRPGRQRAA